MADPEAEILTGQPFRYASTFEAQKEAAQERRVGSAECHVSVGIESAATSARSK